MPSQSTSQYENDPTKNPVLAARVRLEREIRAKFPAGRHWDTRAMVKTVEAIERRDPRLTRYTQDAIKAMQEGS